jgi:hypothetical protein
MQAAEAFSAALIRDGGLAAFALAVLACEIAWFIWRARASRLHLSTIPTLLAGTSIMAALYVALSDGSAVIVVAFLLLSLAAHAIDLYVRVVLDAPPRA